MKSRNFFYSLTSIILTSFLVSVFIVFAADPGTPFAPSDNVQDPGDTGTGWGGCGPTDPNCYVTVSSAISDLTAADSTNTIDNGNYSQEWQWNTLEDGVGLKLSSNSDLGAPGHSVLNVSTTGENVGDGVLTYAGYFSNDRGGGAVGDYINIGVYGTALNTDGGATEGYGVYGVASDDFGAAGIGVYGYSGLGYGIGGFSSSGVGVTGYAYNAGVGMFAGAENTGLPLKIQKAGSSGNSVYTAIEIHGLASGILGDGLGSSIDFKIETSADPIKLSNQIISKWTESDNATRTSEFSITGVNNAVTSTLFTISGNGNTGIGDTTPASMLTVGNGDLFQVASDGSIDAITGYIQGSGTMSLTSANTTQLTTSSIFALNGNSLTSGTGFYGASSTLSSGSLIDVAITGTAGLTNQKGINVSLSGANAIGGQTTYGGYFSNTHTGTSINVGLYATASGGSTNYAASLNGILLLGALPLENIGTRSISIGAGTPSVTDSFFFGTNAGASATGANNSVFIGPEAGELATNALNSVFLGFQAGETASAADYSVFLGDQAGEDATNANEAVYIGRRAGQNSLDAQNSVFLGEDAGWSADNASESIFIGTAAGSNDAVINDNTKYSILLGPGTSTGGFSSSIAIGRGATNTASNQLVIGSSTGGTNSISSVFFGSGVTATSPTGVAINGSGASGSDIAGASLTFAGGKATGNALGGSLIFQTSDAGASGATLQSLSTKATILASGNFGIGDTTPDYLLDVEKTSTDGYIFALHDSDGECLHDPEAGAETVTCSSDERLKTNIVDSDSVLEYLNSFRIRNYDVIASGNNMTGVIAQEVLENHPELVSMLSGGMYSVQLPNQWKLVKGIQELDIKLRDINDFENEGNSFGEKFIAWFASSTNGIKKLFVKDEICIGETCINEEQLKEILAGQKNVSANNNENNEEDTDEVIEEDLVIEEDEEDGTIEESAPEEIIPAEEEELNEPEEIINQEQENTNEENHQNDQSSN